MGDRGSNDAHDGQNRLPDWSRGKRQAKTQKVVTLSWAKQEGREILTDIQYWYVVGIVERLTEFGNKAATVDLRITSFGRFWALKLKGSWLGKINLRIYFAHLSDRGEIVILMAYKKEEDRRVSPHIMTSLEDRLEQYLAGTTSGASVYEQTSDDQADC